MRKVLLTWRGLEIHAYPAMLYTGLVVGIVASHALAARSGLDGGRVYGALLILVVPALAGARLLYAVLHWNVFRREPSRLWNRAEGGAALYGGLLLAFAFSLPIVPLFGIPFGAFWDVATLTILVGMAFTKVGCLLHGCCSGRPTRGWLALRLPDARGVVCPRVPSQLLEAGLALALIGVSVLVWGRRPFPGAVFLLALMGYGAGRFALEPARETVDRLGGLSVNRLLSALLVAAAAGVMAWRW